MTNGPLSPTERIYFDDPFLLAIGARVLGTRTVNGRTLVALDRTVFYPEGGGQLADRGSLGPSSVIDVQVDDQGVIWHDLQEMASAPEPGSEVSLSVDSERRRQHAALHTAQHLLSRAFKDLASAETASARLSEKTATIDLDVKDLSESKVLEVEDAINAVIEDDLKIRQWFPEPMELQALALRKAPKVDDRIRVVMVDGFDVTPCGGTHCKSTAQVGLVALSGIERLKGQTRVTFLAGRSARGESLARSRVLVELGRMFTTGPKEAILGVEKLRTEVRASQQVAGTYRQRWLEAFARDLESEAKSRGQGRIVALLEGDPLDTVRMLAARLCSREGSLAFVASRDAEGLGVVVARGPGSSMDCGAWLKAAVARHGGRGGGRPERAEGRLPSSVDWVALAGSTHEEPVA